MRWWQNQRIRIDGSLSLTPYNDYYVAHRGWIDFLRVTIDVAEFHMVRKPKYLFR
jgi:hypothetical protein